MVLQQGTAKGAHHGECWNHPRLWLSSHHAETCLEKGYSSMTYVPGSGSQEGLPGPCMTYEVKSLAQANSSAGNYLE